VSLFAWILSQLVTGKQSPDIQGGATLFFVTKLRHIDVVDDHIFDHESLYHTQK